MVNAVLSIASAPAVSLHRPGRPGKLAFHRRAFGLRLSDAFAATLPQRRAD
jgi:hypothetical protein